MKLRDARQHKQIDHPASVDRALHSVAGILQAQFGSFKGGRVKPREHLKMFVAQAAACFT